MEKGGEIREEKGRGEGEEEGEAKQGRREEVDTNPAPPPLLRSYS